MEREIKFRAKRWDNKEFCYGSIIMIIDPTIEETTFNNAFMHGGVNISPTIRVDYQTVGQFTGIKDKKGVDIYEGDIISFRKPYRSTQTHTGDNIPNGSYTEPMEPEIKTTEEAVIFKDGMFCIEENDNCPLTWCGGDYDEEGIREAIGWRGKDLFDWNDPTEGELSYLLETYKLKDVSELIDFVSGVEVIGNIYEEAEVKTS